jgi:predicted nucleic acid-binding protein
MSAELFVDASAWIALADADDQHYAEAAKLYPDLLKNYRRLVTTNLIVAEAYILIRRELGHEAGITFLSRIKASPRIERVYADAELEAQAETILGRYQDQLFSYADAVSFALMRQRGIEEAFAFDKYFAVAGFSLLPHKSNVG